MSQENAGSENLDNQNKDAGGAESKEEYVKREAYEQVAKDMHKNKHAKKELEAKNAELEARLKAIEEAKMIEEKQFDELYKSEKAEKERLLESMRQKDELYMKAVKKSALKAELGNIKDEYLVHADIDSIELRDDGTLSSESVLEVANKFRQDHGSLIPKQSNDNITDQAPANSAPARNVKGLSDIADDASALRDLLATKRANERN